MPRPMITIDPIARRQSYAPLANGLFSLVNQADVYLDKSRSSIGAMSALHCSGSDRGEVCLFWTLDSIYV